MPGLLETLTSLPQFRRPLHSRFISVTLCILGRFRRLGPVHELGLLLLLRAASARAAAAAADRHKPSGLCHDESFIGVALVGHLSLHGRRRAALHASTQARGSGEQGLLVASPIDGGSNESTDLLARSCASFSERHGGPFT